MVLIMVSVIVSLEVNVFKFVDVSKTVEVNEITLVFKLVNSLVCEDVLSSTITAVFISVTALVIECVTIFVVVIT